MRSPCGASWPRPRSSWSRSGGSCSPQWPTPHHYMERRAIVDAVPDDVVRMTPAQVAEWVRAEPGAVVEMARSAEPSEHHAADG